VSSPGSEAWHHECPELRCRGVPASELNLPIATGLARACRWSPTRIFVAWTRGVLLQPPLPGAGLYDCFLTSLRQSSRSQAAPPLGPRVGPAYAGLPCGISAIQEFKPRRPAREAPAYGTAATLTQIGSSIGTPAYMAPGLRLAGARDVPRPVRARGRPREPASRRRPSLTECLGLFLVELRDGHGLPDRWCRRGGSRARRHDDLHLRGGPSLDRAPRRPRPLRDPDSARCPFGRDPGRPAPVIAHGTVPGGDRISQRRRRPLPRSAHQSAP
jgi:hypothetical protein